MANGTTDVKLSRPIKANGVEVSELRMREPVVNDQLVMEEMSGSDALKELAMIANLCQVAPDDLKQLTLRDYKKVQKAFVGFIG